VTYKKGNIILYVDQGIIQFQKRLASIIAEKYNRVKHCIQVFNMTTASFEALRFQKCPIAWSTLIMYVHHFSRHPV